jgi:hypothetical protein
MDPVPIAASTAADDEYDPENNKFWMKSQFYVGYTAREIEEEWLRWLLEGRPVLMWHGGTAITAEEAVTELEYERVELCSSRKKINARAVEAALQFRYNDMPLGQRLWRYADMGANVDVPGDEKKIHKVFLAYSVHAMRMLLNADIKVD